nr:6-bladed beta-propeller [Acanthopleuribacter pedis]
MIEPINTENSDNFHRIEDLVIFQNFIYTSDRDTGQIHQLNLNGDHVRSFAGQGQGPGENEQTSALVGYKDQLFALDKKGSKISVYSLTGEYLKQVRLAQISGSLDLTGRKLVASPVNLEGVFSSIDPDKGEVKTFSLQNLEDWSRPSPSSRYASLWRGIEATATPTGNLVIGMIFLDQVAEVTTEGDLVSAWDGSGFLPIHETAVNGERLPKYFSGITYEVGPEGGIWFAASEEGKTGASPILFKLNMATQRIEKRKNFKEHIRLIRYSLPDKKWALVLENQSIQVFTETEWKKNLE